MPLYKNLSTISGVSILQTADQTGSTNSANITVRSGATVDGNSGEAILETSDPSGSGTRGHVRVNGNAVVISADSTFSADAPTSATLSTNGNVSVYPYSNITPGFKLWEGSGTYGITLKAQDSLAADRTLKLPNAADAANQVMIANGSGVLSWQTLFTLPTTYTATLSHSTGIASSVFKWHRETHWLVVSGQILFSGAGDAADFTFALPGVAAGSPVIDTSELVGGTNTGNDTSTSLGKGIWFDSGVGWKALWPKYVSTTTVGFFTVNQKWWNSLGASGDSLNFDIRVPIVGW